MAIIVVIITANNSSYWLRNKRNTIILALANEKTVPFQIWPKTTFNDISNKQQRAKKKLSESTGVFYSGDNFYRLITLEHRLDKLSSHHLCSLQWMAFTLICILLFSGVKRKKKQNKTKTKNKQTKKIGTYIYTVRAQSRTFTYI